MCLAGIAQPAVAQNIDTRAAAANTIFTFGYGASQTYGQTFTVPAGQGSVTSFSFSTSSVPATTTFRGVLMRWDTATARAIGPVLYQSGDVATTGATPQDVTFTIPGGAAVTPGQTYVIFGTVVNSAGSNGGAWALTPADALPGGSFVFQNMSTQADWTGSPWSIALDPQDAGVTIDFAPLPTIPTLSEWAMVGLTLTLAGVGAVFVTRRRRVA